MLMILGLEVNLLTLAGERRRPEPLWRESLGLLAWSVPGALAGVAVLRALDETTLQVVVTIGVLTSLGVRRLHRDVVRSTPPPVWALPVAGLAAGTLNTATSTSGPALVLYLLRRAASPGATRDTMTVIFVAFSFIGGAALVVTGTREAIPEAAALAAGVPLVLAGHLAGRRGFARLSRSPRRYELALTVVLLLSAVGGLLTVLI
jgi:uncharacterized membrane protein YfcA